METTPTNEAYTRTDLQFLSTAATILQRQFTRCNKNQQPNDEQFRKCTKCKQITGKVLYREPKTTGTI